MKMAQNRLVGHCPSVPNHTITNIHAYFSESTSIFLHSFLFMLNSKIIIMANFNEDEK